MRKHEKVPATQKQYGELSGALIGEMNFSKDEATAIIGRLGGFRRQVREFYSQFQDQSVTSSDLLRWDEVYKRLFGQIPNWNRIVIPAKPPEEIGPVRLIAIPQDICEWTNDQPIQGTFSALSKFFPIWGEYPGRLGRIIGQNVRAPQLGSYAVWVRDVREAIDGFDLESLSGITLLERFLLEADYFFEQGEHLDCERITRCSGSRFLDNGVPMTKWHENRIFSVTKGAQSDRSSMLGSRSVWP